MEQQGEEVLKKLQVKFNEDLRKAREEAEQAGLELKGMQETRER